MKGTVFQPLAEDMHPWFIISDEKNGKVLAVNVTDFHKCPDSPCVLNVGDHESIVKKSAVHYYYSQVYAVKKLQKDLVKYCTVFKTPCSKEVMGRIIAGAFVPDNDLTGKLLDYLR